MAFGGLDDILGGTGGGSLGFEAPSPSDLINEGGFALSAFITNFLFQFMGGTLAGGGKKDLVPGLFDKKGKGITFKKAADKGLGGVVSIGKNKFKVSATQEQMFAQAQIFEDQQIESLVKTQGKLFGPDGPAFLQDTALQAQGKHPSIAEFGSNLVDIQQKAVGGSSFGHDVNAQKFLAAGLAADFTKFKFGVQQQGLAAMLKQIGTGQLFNPQVLAQGANPNFALGVGQAGANVGVASSQIAFAAAKEFNTAGLGVGFLAGIAGGQQQKSGFEQGLAAGTS